MITDPPFIPKSNQSCFLVVCKDRPDAVDLRRHHLAGHLKHVETHWRRYVTAGPIREPGEDALCGSVFLVLADTLEDAQSLMGGDPYISCGMYESIEYKEFTNSIGQFIGGKIWESIESIQHRAAGGPTNDLSKGV